jgi:hypothetical protein
MTGVRKSLLVNFDDARRYRRLFVPVAKTSNDVTQRLHFGFGGF